ncbi:hypothetical protein [Mesorhizobium sp. NPDC059025]|uniref:hypothetical protein n=1 Tax=unclassified Mesorhizobium TaxID=325217 RepID=UPI0036CF7E37
MKSQSRRRGWQALVVVAVVASISMVALVCEVFQRIEATRVQYLHFLEAMYSNQAIAVNFLPSREHTFPFAVRKKLTVAIDGEIEPDYLERVKTAFQFMTELMGSTVAFTLVGEDYGFRDDFYAYIAYKKDADAFRPSYIADFTKKMRGAISGVYRNRMENVLWSYFKLSPVNNYFGSSFYFNKEYEGMPFNDIVAESAEIRKRRPNSVPETVLSGDVSYKIRNPIPEKAVLYTSTRNDDGIEPKKFKKFTGEIVVQEVFQMLAQQNDLNIPELRLKTLLHDADDEARYGGYNMDGVVDYMNKNAVRGMCVLDVMYLSQLSETSAENFRWQLMKANWITYARLYLEAYVRYWSGPKELFDSRCW